MKDGTLRANRAAHLTKLRHLYTIPGPVPDEVTEFEHNAQIGSHTHKVKIYVPAKKPASGSPVILMLHEGGWCMGDLSDEDQNCRLFSRDLGAVCVNVDYALAPEYEFPAGLVDVGHVVEWCRLTAHPDSLILPGDLRQGFIIGGTSAGGNLAAAECQSTRDRAMDPPLTGQFLCVPALLWPTAVPEKWRSEYRSRFESKSDPVFRLDTKGDQDLVEMLKPNVSSPMFSPLLHANLRDLPPAFFQVAGLDPLKDEGLLYERVLRENRVPTQVRLAKESVRFRLILT